MIAVEISVSRFLETGIVRERWVLDSKNLNSQTKTSEELQMLSSVTLNYQITKIVMNSSSEFSEL